MKIGLVLGGGGARGAYQLGVLKALMEFNLHEQISSVSGTSVGAMNALLLMSNMTYDEMNALWHKIDNEKLYVDGLGRYKHDLKGIFSINEVYDVLVENRSIAEVQNSRIQGYATIVNVPDDKVISQINVRKMKREVVDLNKAEDPYKIGLASASIPLLFGPTVINGAYYIDGGVKDNLPIKTLIDDGCDLLITVSLFATTKIRRYRGKVALIDITPKFPLGFLPVAMLDFSHKAIEKKTELGYHNTREMLAYLKEKGYDELMHLQSQKRYFVNLKKVERYNKRQARKQKRQAKRLK